MAGLFGKGLLPKAPKKSKQNLRPKRFASLKLRVRKSRGSI